MDEAKCVWLCDLMIDVMFWALECAYLHYGNVLMMKSWNLWDPWCPTELFLKYTCKGGLETSKKSEADGWVYEMDFVVCVKILTPIRRDSYRVCFKDFVMSCWSGNHPQNNVANFGYIQDMKVAKKENPCLFLATYYFS